jgi:hypothetical protein
VGVENHSVKRFKSREIVYVRDGDSAFLNVDVDVISTVPLDSLVVALGQEVLINYVGRERRRYSAHFSSYDPRNADAAIRRLARLIAKLPKPARQLWNQASKRVFNVGFQGGFRPQTLETEITSAAVEAAAGLGASIAVTIYAVEDTSAKRATCGSKGR